MLEQEPHEIVSGLEKERSTYESRHRLAETALNGLDYTFRLNAADAAEKRAKHLVDEHQDVVQSHARAEMEADFSSQKNA